MDFKEIRENNPIAYISYLYKDFKRYCEDYLSPYDLSNGRYFYLIYINRYPGCSLADMSLDFKVDKAYVTRVIHKLCGLGYIEKVKSKEDSRACSLSLTDNGIRVLSEIKDLFHNWNEDLREVLSEEEMTSFTQLLSKVFLAKKKGRIVP